MKQGEVTHKIGFTLIELLIVVAIIAILAAIAVPNFLEAQARAKLSRAQADLKTVYTASTTYQLDNGKVFPDNNDADTPPENRGKTFRDEKIDPDVKFVNNAEGTFATFYTFCAWKPLTTPVAYMNSVPKDPFSKVMPLGFDTFEPQPYNVEYTVFFSAGPDATDGDWYRDTSPTGKSIPYDATNGTKSRGDIWRSVQVKNMNTYKTHYGEIFY
jgi:prepilin-type N-terminal cleavage/methylation domain-containing protein